MALGSAIFTITNFWFVNLIFLGAVDILLVR